MKNLTITLATLLTTNQAHAHVGDHSAIESASIISHLTSSPFHMALLLGVIALLALCSLYWKKR